MTEQFPNNSYILSPFSATPNADMARAAEISAALGVQINTNFVPDEETLYLELSSSGLSLCKGSLRMQGDFSSMLSRIKKGVLGTELLVKASRIKDNDGPLTAIDATAGMGEDSLLLAAAGYNVTMYEYDPVIAQLLIDSLKRAADIPELAEITSRMNVICGDSISALNSLKVSPDLIYLDPMFPSRSKSALIKKKFQLLHCLEQPCTNEEELMQAAIKAHPHKLVIKRPVKGPYLAGIKPSYSIEGKAVRYDCLVYAR